MTWNIMRLEERIVLEADVANAVDQAPDASGGEMPPGDVGNTEYSGNAGDTGDTDNAGDGVRLLVVSSAVDQAETLAGAAMEGVLACVYDGNSGDLDALLDTMEDLLDGQQADSIAFATHDLGAGNFHLSGGYTVNASTLLSDPDLQEFWESVGNLLDEDGRIDILSCGLASTDQGDLAISLLEDAAGHGVAASDDATGNPGDGGDWILETDGVDAAALYFNAERLQDFSGLLAGEDKLTASDAAAGDLFGCSVCLDGNYALVGARGDNDNGSLSGSVYVFFRDGVAGDADGIDNWTQQAKLTAFDGAANDMFGHSLSLDGNYAVVGAIGDDDLGSFSGSVYVFFRDGVTGDADGIDYWTRQAKLTASDGAAGDGFGSSVSLDGTSVVIGAYGDGDHGAYSGSAYVFIRDGVTGDADGIDYWTQQAKLTASDGATSDKFGNELSLSGDYIVVGVSSDDDLGADSGSAYIFFRDGVTGDADGIDYWTQQAKLTAADGAASDFFGDSVSIAGGHIIIGASGDDDHGSGSGSAYIYIRDGITGDADGIDHWTQLSKPAATDGDVDDNFGTAVFINGNYAIVGVRQDDDHGASSGSAYIFTIAPAATIAPAQGSGGGEKGGGYSGGLLPDQDGFGGFNLNPGPGPGFGTGFFTPGGPGAAGGPDFGAGGAINGYGALLAHALGLTGRTTPFAFAYPETIRIANFLLENSGKAQRVFENLLSSIPGLGQRTHNDLADLNSEILDIMFGDQDSVDIEALRAAVLDLTGVVHKLSPSELARFQGMISVWIQSLKLQLNTLPDDPAIQDLLDQLAAIEQELTATA